MPKKGAALAMAKLLVEAGMDPNGPQDPQSIPPIIMAAFRGNVKLVEYLLAQPKIEVDKRDIDGQTALLVAAKKGNARIVDLLLEAGADPTLKNERGETPEDKAQQNIDKFEGIIKRLGR